jgi:hypothetical protein
MTDQESSLSMLKGRQLSAVTFVQNYIQFHFDGPYLNTYVWPRLLNGEEFSPRTPGYRDALCNRIGKAVVDTVEERNDKLAIEFDDGVVMEVSLREADRESLEAAMFQDGSSGEVWDVWY